jgi:hypothetical protein
MLRPTQIRDCPLDRQPIGLAGRERSCLPHPFAEYRHHLSQEVSNRCWSLVLILWTAQSAVKSSSLIGRGGFRSAARTTFRVIARPGR